MSVPEPGVYRDVSFETYQAWDAANNSLLGEFARTPAHARYVQIHGRPETEAKALGHAVHLAVLEPERFSREVVVAPDVDRRTKQGKAAWREFLAEYPTATLVKADDHARVLAMRESLLGHPTAGLFFRGRGMNEVSIVWDEAETGVRSKARLDRIAAINGAVVIGDLKTARDASRRAFEKEMASYGYARQQAHYTAGVQKAMPGQPRRFVFFVVESAPPYPTACYQIDDASIAHAEEERQRFLRTYRDCRASGRWPAYSDGIDEASLPAWLMKRWTDEEVVA